MSEPQHGVCPDRSEVQARFAELFAEAAEGRKTLAPVSSSHIAAAESHLGVVLPLAYKQFVQTHGPVGTRTSHRICDQQWAESRYPHFDMLMPQEVEPANQQTWLTPLWPHVTGLADIANLNVFQYFVAFAADGLDNLLCFPRCVVTNDDLPVLLFDHELGGVHQVAPSFDLFLWWYVRHVSLGTSAERAASAGVRPPERSLQFTAENDHNPTYDERCDRCGGFGKLFVVKHDRPRCTEDDRPCPDCGATGRVHRRLFDNDNPPMEATSGKNGWTTCPQCGWRFSVKDKNIWTGYRHKRCGQRIVLRNG